MKNQIGHLFAINQPNLTVITHQPFSKHLSNFKITPAFVLSSILLLGRLLLAHFMIIFSVSFEGAMYNVLNCSS